MKPIRMAKRTEERHHHDLWILQYNYSMGGTVMTLLL